MFFEDNFEDTEYCICEYCNELIKGTIYIINGFYHACFDCYLGDCDDINSNLG